MTAVEESSGDAKQDQPQCPYQTWNLFPVWLAAGFLVRLPPPNLTEAEG